MPEPKDVRFKPADDVDGSEREREDIEVIYIYVRQYLEYFKGETLNMSEAVVARQMIQDVYNKSIGYWQRKRDGRYLKGDRGGMRGGIADDAIELFLTTHIGLPSDMMGSRGEDGGFKMNLAEINAIWKKRNRDTEQL